MNANQLQQSMKKMQKGIVKFQEDMQDLSEKSGYKISVGYELGNEKKEVVLGDPDNKKGTKKKIYSDNLMPVEGLDVNVIGGSQFDDQGKIKEEMKKTPIDSVSDSVQILMNVENILKEGAARLDLVSEEIKLKTEMVKGVLLNDEAYREIDKSIKELNKQRLKVKKVLLGRSEVRITIESLNDIKQEKKELLSAQSDYLREYSRLSGSNQLSLFDGQVMEIITVHKMVKNRK